MKRSNSGKTMIGNEVSRPSGGMAIEPKEKARSRKRGWFWMGVGLLICGGVWWGRFVVEIEQGASPTGFAIDFAVFAGIVTGVGIYCVRRSSRQSI